MEEKLWTQLGLDPALFENALKNAIQDGSNALQDKLWKWGIYF